MIRELKTMALVQVGLVLGLSVPARAIAPVPPECLLKSRPMTEVCILKSSADLGWRLSALHYVARHPQLSLPLLRKCIKDRRGSWEYCVKAMGQIGPAAAGQLDVILAVLQSKPKDKAYDAKNYAAESLGLIGVMNVRVLRIGRRILGSVRGRNARNLGSRRRYLLRGLAKLGAAASPLVPDIVKLLQHKECRNPFLAARVLGNIGIPDRTVLSVAIGMIRSPPKDRGLWMGGSREPWEFARLAARMANRNQVKQVTSAIIEAKTTREQFDGLTTVLSTDWIKMLAAVSTVDNSEAIRYRAKESVAAIVIRRLAKETCGGKVDFPPAQLRYVEDALFAGIAEGAGYSCLHLGLALSHMPSRERVRSRLTKMLRKKRLEDPRDIWSHALWKIVEYQLHPSLNDTEQAKRLRALPIGKSKLELHIEARLFGAIAAPTKSTAHRLQRIFAIGRTISGGNGGAIRSDYLKCSG
jgi:hypothetical protein